jgi:hypothetical protein
MEVQKRSRLSGTLSKRGPRANAFQQWQAQGNAPGTQQEAAAIQELNVFFRHRDPSKLYC